MPYTKKQERFLRGVAGGMTPRGGVGPSADTARSMLSHSDRQGGRRRRGRDDEDTPNEREQRRRKRRRAMRGAVEGYEREGGLWEKIKKRLFGGAQKARELAKPKD